MSTLKKTTGPFHYHYRHIMVISTWGFVIAIASFLFLQMGYRIDQYFGTEPTFMLGLFFLAIFLCIGRLYQEAWVRRKEI